MNKKVSKILNKKLLFGFTLIEMIAAIVLLSVIALIVYPTINRVIVNNKEKAYVRQIDVIKEAAANWLTFNEDKLKDGSYPLPIDDILSNGLIEEDNLINPINNEEINGCIIITWRKGTKQYDYSYTTSCNDFVIPKLLSFSTNVSENEYGWRNKDFNISLNGNDLESYYYCISEDKCNPDIMVSDINDTILFNEEGIKYVCAYGMNKSGETEEICEKYKLDKTPPTIGTIVFSGTKGLNDWYISNVSVTYTESTDSLSKIDTNVLSPSETLITKDTAGTTYTLTAKDKAGNVSEVSYSVKVDKTAPTIGELVINGTKGKNDWYISDLTFSVVDGNDSMSGHNTTTSSISSLTTETKGKTVTVTTMDNAGNKTTKDYIIKMDKTAPTVGELVINGTKGSNDWYTSDLTFSVTNGSDTISDHKSTTSSITSLTTETSGTTVTVTTENNAGLISTKDYNIKLDKTPPTVGELVVNGTLGENDWYTSNLTFTVNDGSDSLSGHNSTTSSISSITSDTNGTTVTVTTKDNAGLTSTKNYSFKVDKTAPTCTLAVATSGVSFKTKSSDVTSSGISTSTSASYSSQTASLSANTFYGYLKDRAGNTGKCSATIQTTTPSYTKTTTTCNEKTTDNPTYYYIKQTKTCGREQTDTTYSCSSGTYPNDGGNYCYTYSSGSSYNGCSSGTYSGGTCTLTNQSSCSSGWSSTVTTAAKYKCTKSPTTKNCTDLSSSSSKCEATGSCYFSTVSSTCLGGTYKYCSSGTLTNGYCTFTNQSSCSTGWTSTVTTAAKYKCTRSADTCASGWSTCSWCSSSKCKKVASTVTKTPVYSYSFGSTSTSTNQTSCSSNTFACSSSTYGSTYVSCTLSNTVHNYTYSYSSSSSYAYNQGTCSASTGYSSCSGSYSSSQSSMKNKVNVTCATSGYTCNSGYTKLSDSYCYKIN